MAIGLAVGSKFAAVVLVLPLSLTLRLVRTRGHRLVLPALALAALGVAATFALTNPFALLDWGCEALTPQVPG